MSIHQSQMVVHSSGMAHHAFTVLPAQIPPRVYYLRLALPDFLANILGQQERIRTLDTRSSNTASTSGYQVSLRIKPLFQRLRRIMSIDPNSLDPDSVRQPIVDEMDDGFQTRWQCQHQGR